MVQVKTACVPYESATGVGLAVAWTELSPVGTDPGPMAGSDVSGVAGSELSPVAMPTTGSDVAGVGSTVEGVDVVEDGRRVMALRSAPSRD